MCECVCVCVCVCIFMCERVYVCMYCEASSGNGFGWGGNMGLEREKVLNWAVKSTMSHSSLVVNSLERNGAV